ncbi:16S rRNA (guanine527-N7)-methyltransferase [Desulfobaculum xiamenense]|uniref:Ribosomal RNA small subunit methyltransferase G n=1 Tax=Desulfobaculum xiamenense TaxID=995050 RepID=A0A846QS56_9BACT|nr:RsmG family class I SAM-dependent methyltransferase [Desulfobaculum xiamenense]NJB69372.1 16S rRNA (guanine527-N7)-methyltransferase [Desulfobaculum xiamenense]
MGKPTPENVAEQAARLGRSITAEQARLLSLYLDALLKWNKAMNLVAHGDWTRVLSDLVADSWHLADFLAELPVAAEPSTLDLGAGAGLPGIPLRVFWERGEYRMVEIREKRVAFMRYALSRLRLARTSALGCRVEELPEELFPVDLILSRAFRPWPEVLAFALPRLQANGLCIILANAPMPDDMAEAPGWRSVGSREYETGGKSRYFWAFTPESASR